MKRRSPLNLIIDFIVMACILLGGRLILPIIAAPVGDQNSFLVDRYYSGIECTGQPEPWMLARADQSDIGKTVTVSFPQLLKDAQYDDKWYVFESIKIAYLQNADSAGRLLVLENVEGNDWASCLTIYEPEWVGVDALMENLNREFRAKVICRVNILRDEMQYFGAAISSALRADPSLAIDPSSDQAASRQEPLFFCGKIAYIDSDKKYADGIFKIREDIWASFSCCELSAALNANDQFTQIIQRYDLEEYLGI